MEADLSRNCVIVAFAITAVTSMQYKLPIIVTIMLLTHIGTIPSTVRRSGGAVFHWCFDGSLLSSFLGSIRSPRYHDLHDRERGQVSPSGKASCQSRAITLHGKEARLRGLEFGRRPRLQPNRPADAYQFRKL
jgi:hypothetical protein